MAICLQKSALLAGVQKIRQSEVMDKLGIRQSDICGLRDEYLTADDWWLEARTMYWTVAAAAKVAAALGKEWPVVEPAPVEAEVQPYVDPMPTLCEPYVNPIPAAPDNAITEVSPTVTATARVLKACRNQRFVYAALGGERIVVDCGKKIASKIVGKVITARVEQIDGETKYFYAR